MKYKNVPETKKFIEKFENIRYNESEKYFEFVCDYTKFSDKKFGNRKKWTICSFGERIRTTRDNKANNHWTSQIVKLTEEFENLFNEFSIDKNDIKGSILRLPEDKKKFFETFMYLFKLTIQLRNSKTGSLEDYILSPVKNAKGEFFDSRKCGEDLPKDADANGAYNIARKGLMLINRIKETAENKKVDYAISNAEWLEYVQNQDRT